MAFGEKQTNKQTAPLGATKYEKKNDECFIVLKLALELSKYRYGGYLFVFKIYCSNFENMKTKGSVYNAHLDFGGKICEKKVRIIHG